MFGLLVRIISVEMASSLFATIWNDYPGFQIDKYTTENYDSGLGVTLILWRSDIDSCGFLFLFQRRSLERISTNEITGLINY